MENIKIKYSVYSCSCVWAFTVKLPGDFVNQSLKIVKRFFFCFPSQPVSLQAIFASECNVS